MLYTFKIYLAYFAQFLKGRLAYKADFFAAIFANVLMTISGLLFIFFLIDGQTIPTIKGWKREEVIFIYGYSLIPMSIFSTFAYNLYQFGNRYIIEGQFDRVLLRPLNTVSQVMFESFNLESIGSLLTGVGVLIYTSSALAIKFDFFDYLWLFVSGISGGVILLSVFVCVASISFHFEDRLGIAAPIFGLIAFGRYPIPIFNKVIQFLLSWIIPFAFVAFYPSTHFFDHTGFEFLCYFTPVMALICMAVAALSWNFGVSRYSSTGN